MQTTIRIVDEHNNLVPKEELRPWVTIPTTVVGSKYDPVNDILELTVLYQKDAKFIYTNQTRKTGKR